MQHWPREIAFPKRQIVRNEDEFIKLITSYNGKKNIYFSLYNCSSNYQYNNISGNFENCIIDKVFFDLDGDTLQKPFEDLKKLITYAKANNYKFTMCFSGKKGFHFYLFCKHTHSKDLLKNSQEYIAKRLMIDVDKHIVGDIARISRVPNSLHLTGNKYCISLSLTDIKLGLEHIKEKAKQQNITFYVYGKELIDLKQFPDISKEHTNGNDIPKFNYDTIIENTDKLLEDFPACVNLWLTSEEHSTHHNRFLFALYCCHSGLSPEECNSLAKKYYGQIKEKHGRRTRYQEFKSEKAIDYAYGKEWIIPSCNKLFKDHQCLGQCPLYCKNNFPLYKEVKR